MSWPLQALEYSTLAIRSYHDSGNTTQVHTGPAVTAVWIRELDTAIIHLRHALGDQTSESLARTGETMTTAAMAAYAYDQIDHARTELGHST